MTEAEIKDLAKQIVAELTKEENARKIVDMFMNTPVNLNCDLSNWFNKHSNYSGTGPSGPPKPDEFSKHNFTIMFSSNNVDNHVTAQCQELGIGAEGQGKQDALKNIRAKINEHLEEKEND